MDYDVLKKIEKIIAYEFNELGLLQQAFTRRSYAEENGGEDNDILEFYGDEALDYSIARFLQDKFGDISDNRFVSKFNAGELTQLKSYLVDSEMLSHRIDELELAQYLVMGKGDSRQDVNKVQSVKEQLFEALIGAVAIDSEHDLMAIDSTVTKMLNPDKYIAEYSIDGINYVEVMQKWNQIMHKKLPVYSEALMENDEWNVSLILKIEEKEHTFNGKGSTKSLARRSAAKAAYLYLDSNDLLDKKVEIDVLNGVDLSNAYDKLKDLENQRKILKAEIEEFKQEKNSLGNDVWPVTVEAVDNNQKKFSSTVSSTSKKKAKNEAALEVLKKIGKITVLVGVTAGLAVITKGKIIKK